MDAAPFGDAQRPPREPWVAGCLPQPSRARERVRRTRPSTPLLSILPQRLPYLCQLGAPLLWAVATLFPHGQPSHRSQESCQKDEAEDEHNFPSNHRHLFLPLSPHLARPGQAARQRARPEATKPALPRESERSGEKNKTITITIIYKVSQAGGAVPRGCGQGPRQGLPARAAPLPLISLAVSRARFGVATPPGSPPVPLMLKDNSEKLHKCVRGGRSGGGEREGFASPPPFLILSAI